MAERRSDFYGHRKITNLFVVCKVVAYKIATYENNGAISENPLKTLKICPTRLCYGLEVRTARLKCFSLEYQTEPAMHKRLVQNKASFIHWQFITCSNFL